jgi:hypothetical protein
VHDFVEKFVADLSQADHKVVQRRVTPRRRAAPAWIPPPQSFLKINVDTAIEKSTCRDSVAVVARDACGRFQRAAVVVFPGKTESETLEALACREAIALAET